MQNALVASNITTMASSMTTGPESECHFTLRERQTDRQRETHSESQREREREIAVG